MYVPPAIKDRVNAKLTEAIETIKRVYKVEIKFPRVVYEKRGTTAGTANYRTWTVDFNAALLMQNIDDFIARTVPHELAHLACDQIYPEAHRPSMSMFQASGRRQKREVHGPRWQEIMTALGVKDITRCHSYDTTTTKIGKASSRVVQWRCSKCGHVLSLTENKSAKLRASPSSMWHKGCAHSRLVEIKGVTPAPVATTPVIQPKMPTMGGSKIDNCKMIYKTNRGVDRALIIDKFIKMAGCTPAGANTYYATCKKLFD